MSSSSLATFAQPLDPSAEKRLAEVQEQLRKLEKRDWWLWSMAIVVMLLLTFAVFSMSFPELTKVDDPFFQFSLNQSVRGLQIRAEEFHRMALVDPLTGLSNRRVADERLKSEASRSQRYGHPLAVVSFDLDKFKEINDTYGHLAGDQVLKEFGARLSQAIRLSDFAARMGGDEFLVLLAECSTNQVEAFLARLRHIEADYGGQKIPIRFSAGWVGYEQGETIEQFLERADRTLYADKRARKTSVKEPLPVT